MSDYSWHPHLKAWSDWLLASGGSRRLQEPGNGKEWKDFAALETKLWLWISVRKIILAAAMWLAQPSRIFCKKDSEAAFKDLAMKQTIALEDSEVALQITRGFFFAVGRRLCVFDRSKSLAGWGCLIVFDFWTCEFLWKWIVFNFTLLIFF